MTWCIPFFRIAPHVAALAALPPDVQAGLREAVNTADLKLAQEMIARFHPQHAALAEALSELVNTYRFDTLVELFSHHSPLTSQCSGQKG